MALLASILRTDSENDSSLGGISSREHGHSCVVIDNIETGRAVTLDESIPHVVIVERSLGGRTVYHAEPVGGHRKDESYGAYMAGGAFVYSSDSRFSAAIGDMYGAIALHDRCEPWDMIARMD